MLNPSPQKLKYISSLFSFEFQTKINELKQSKIIASK